MTQRWSPKDDELDALARSIDPPEATADQIENTRSRLLAAQADTPQSSARSLAPWLAGGAIAVAAAAALIVWLGHDPAPGPVAHTAPRKQVIESLGAARFESVTEWPDYVIRLDDGRVAITVADLEPSERFRVKTADAELEVRSARFVVAADSGRLVSVVVERGWVELRPTGEPARSLHDGERWDRTRTASTDEGAPIPAAPLPTPAIEANPNRPRIAVAAKPPRSPTPPRVVARSPSPAPDPAPPEPAVSVAPPATPPRAPAPGEADFRAGWTALRAGDPAEAAGRFETSCATAGGALSEDACFWSAAAAKRAGRPEARARLERFLRAFPRSGRTGEASALLGWTLYDAGDLVGAEARFRAAVSDRVPKVRDSARRGLTAIERRRNAH